MKNLGKSVPPHAVGLAVLADPQTFEGLTSRTSVRSHGLTRVVCLGLGVVLATFLCACGSTSTANSNSFTIAITTAPPSSMEMGQSVSVAATISRDKSNSGVDWSCTPTPSCGTFSPAHTASGANTTYQAPTTAGSVVITAASTARPSVTASSNVTVNPVTVTISTPPPSSMETSQSALVAATVTGDSSNSGVDWSCTPAPSCGTFSPAHTASGANTTYQAPTTAGSVVITAASTARPSVTATSNVTVNPVTVTISTPPPSSMEINSSVSVAATVNNDLTNGGVDWSCSPAPSCGTFTPAHTASGASTVYQDLNTAETVTITADSTSTPAVSAAATLTVTPVGTVSNLSSTYTFFANGWDSTTSVAQFPSISVAGSIVVDGTNGTITGGEQDFFASSATSPVTQSDPISATGSSITLGSDGRGTLTLQLQQPNSLGNSTEIFSIMLVNNKHLLITEFDGTATSSGSMDLQTSPTSVPTNGNAFALYDAFDGVALGGVMTSDGTTITAGEGDDNDFSLPAPVIGLAVSGSLTSTDAAGRGTINITLADTSSNTVVSNSTYAYYVVGPEAFRLIEIDGTDFAAGSIYGQGNTSGAFSATSLGGSFAFKLAGEPINTLFYGAAGEFTTDSSSALISGVADVNMGDGAPLAAAPLAAGSSYSVASDGYGSIILPGTNTDGLANFGVYMVDPALNLTDPNSTSGGGGALMVNLDANSVGRGLIVPQVTGSNFVGNYAYAQDGSYQTSTATGFFDILGQVVSDGTSNLAGKASYNDADGTGLNSNIGLSGTFAADAADPGRSTAQISLSGQTTPSNISTTNITLYQASSSLLFPVDMDSPSASTGTIAVGAFEKQQ